MQVKIEEKEHVEKKLRKKLRICLEKLKKKKKFKRLKTSKEKVEKKLRKSWEKVEEKKTLKGHLLQNPALN